MTGWRGARKLAEIEASADDFRRQFAPGHLGPLAIGAIIECDLQVEIRPMKGLCRHHDSKAYVCNGGRTIVVDAYLFRSQAAEYRDVLTHETCHLIRHRHHLPPAFISVEQCKAFHAELSPALRNTMEWEAREWSGRVLMPRGALRTAFNTLAQENVELLAELRENPDRHHIFGGMIVDLVADRFGVLPSVAEARIRKDGLWQQFSSFTRDDSKTGGIAG
jgi:hypothetical protein